MRINDPPGDWCSTISTNAAPSMSGIAAYGYFSVAVRLHASTVAANTGSTALVTAGQHCRIQGCITWATMSISASILVGGPGTTACTSANQPPGTYNLAPDGSCGATVAGADLLGPLADNGGPTLTHLPAIGSGAVDAIPLGTPGLCDGTLAEDQRGVARPQGGGCDIGAVER